MEIFNRYFLDILKNKYAQFNGRASRSEFWYFMLFSILGSILFAILDAILGTSFTYEIAGAAAGSGDANTVAVTTTQRIGYLQALFGLAMIIPSIAISIRRLHDIGKSGWWVLLSMIPIVNLIGFFILIYFYIQESQPGANKYGSSPKGV